MPIPLQVVKCYKYIDSQQKQFIEELRELVKIPNVSSSSEARKYVDSAIKWLQARLVRTGFSVELKNTDNKVLPELLSISQTNIPPVILATLGNDRRKKTLLYYCHLDVFKVQSDKWGADPFVLREEKNGKLYGRGTAKMKGPLLCFLHAVDTYQALEINLPINIKIICGQVSLLKSMNECKSLGLADMLQSLRTGFLTNIDCMLMTDGQWTGITYPCILYACRGVCYFNLSIEGLTEDLNSGEYGGVVQEPLQDLIYIVNHLVDKSGTLVIPGLDKDMVQVTPDEEKIYSQLKLNIQEYKKDSGIRKLSHDTSLSQSLMHAWRYPSFNLHYVNTLPPCDCPVNLKIPKTAQARFSIRYEVENLCDIPNKIWVLVYTSLDFYTIILMQLYAYLKRIVPDQTPKKVCRLICDHLNKVLKLRNSPNRARLRMEDSLRPWIADHRHWSYEAAKNASKQVYKDPANLVREGNAYPALLEFQQIMPKTNILLLPLVSGDANINKDEECITLRCYMEGTKLIANYFYNLSIC
ncbi:cytosolic non-specific dipeptidase-like [Diprion similis]|uniref:cytosolic non-specific dipeptidase-like n=1 Tax=Diprion similis TaxID=362088 RepID=UPI001EF77A80|nr:cytosolic non-specific dipeptidase-like [Diprion similis]